MIIAVILILSFLLDGILLSVVDSSTICCPLFTLCSLIIIYPMFEEKGKYKIVSSLLGFFYDICYANTLFLNVFLFLGISYLSEILFRKFSITILNNYLVGIFSIFVYRVLYCFFFVVLGFSTWRSSLFLQSILSSIIINSIYLVVFYLIVKKIRKILKKEKYKLLKVKKSKK